MHIDSSDLGKYAAVEAGLRYFVMQGKRSVGEVVPRIQAIRDGKPDPYTPYSPPLYDEVFTNEAQQVGNLLWWNFVDEIGLSPESIAGSLTQLETASVEGSPLTLCWTLDTLARTLMAKVEIFGSVYDKVAETKLFSELISDRFMLVEGARDFKPNEIWWSRIDLTANGNMAQVDVPPSQAAGIEVFDAACQHSRYMALTDHESTDTPLPSLNATAIQATGLDGRLYLPYLGCRVRSDGATIRVGAGHLRVNEVDDPHATRAQPKSSLPVIVKL